MAFEGENATITSMELPPLRVIGKVSVKFTNVKAEPVGSMEMEEIIMGSPLELKIVNFWTAPTPSEKERMLGAVLSPVHVKGREKEIPSHTACEVKSSCRIANERNRSWRFSINASSGVKATIIIRNFSREGDVGPPGCFSQRE